MRNISSIMKKSMKRCQKNRNNVKKVYFCTFMGYRKQIVSTLRERYLDVSEYIKSDLFRYYGVNNIKVFLRALRRNEAFRFQCILRLCQVQGVIGHCGNILYKLSRIKKKIQIPKNTKIGYGLYIGHGGPVVINSSAVIGNNVNLSQFTTIGSNYGKAAVIGDNVYIGPNVCVVEDVEIGNNVTIGAGSIVVKSIPDNATAVGNYAKVVNYNNPGRFINNRWVHEDRLKQRSWKC